MVRESYTYNGKLIGVVGLCDLLSCHFHNLSSSSSSSNSSSVVSWTQVVDGRPVSNPCAKQFLITKQNQNKLINC